MARPVHRGAIMTAPRFIVPKRTLMVTRRTTRRHHLLRPDADGTSQSLYWYTTAVYAEKYGILIHAAEVLSTHLHEVLTDVHGNLPDFTRDRNHAYANAIKRLRGWHEEVFQRAPASYVVLHGEDAIAEKIGYTLANCVEAGLVRDPSRWPGVRTEIDDMGTRVIEVERPDLYFSPDNDLWPDVARLEITIPPTVEETYGDGSIEFLRRAATSAVDVARKTARALGRVVGSVAQLMRVPFQKRARSEDGYTRGAKTYAARHRPELAAWARAEWRSFLFAYRAARRKIAAALGPVDFPAGSWRWARELARAPNARPNKVVPRGLSRARKAGEQNAFAVTSAAWDGSLRAFA